MMKELRVLNDEEINKVVKEAVREWEKGNTNSKTPLDFIYKAIKQAQFQADIKGFVERLELVTNMYGVDKLILSLKQLVEKPQLEPPPRFDDIYYQGLKNMNKGEQ